MELGEVVASCLGCFDSVEQAYAYNKKATESLDEEHLYMAIVSKSFIVCESYVYIGCMWWAV